MSRLNIFAAAPLSAALLEFTLMLFGPRGTARAETQIPEGGTGATGLTAVLARMFASRAAAAPDPLFEPAFDPELDPWPVPEGRSDGLDVDEDEDEDMSAGAAEPQRW